MGTKWETPFEFGKNCQGVPLLGSQLNKQYLKARFTNETWLLINKFTWMGRAGGQDLFVLLHLDIERNIIQLRPTSQYTIQKFNFAFNQKVATFLNALHLRVTRVDDSETDQPAAIEIKRSPLALKALERSCPSFSNHLQPIQSNGINENLRQSINFGFAGLFEVVWDTQINQFIAIRITSRQTGRIYLCSSHQDGITIGAIWANQTDQCNDTGITKKR